MAALQLRSVQGLRAPLATRASRRPVVVKAMKEEVDRVKQAAVAGLVATALLTGAMATPEEALVTLVAFTNGATGAANPQRQGLSSAIKDGLSPLNVAANFPGQVRVCKGEWEERRREEEKAVRGGREGEREEGGGRGLLGVRLLALPRRPSAASVRA